MTLRWPIFVVYLFLFLQPVLGLSYYYFKISGIELVNLILFISFSLILFFLKSGKHIIMFSFVIVLVSFSSLLHIYSSDLYSYDAVIKQSVLLISFLLIVIYGHHINLFKIFSANVKLIYLFLIFDICILIFFKLNLFDYSIYGSFESSYLFPSYIYSLVTLNGPLIVVHLLAIILHDKRMVTLVAIIILLGYFALNSKLSFKKNMYLFGVIFLCFMLYYFGFLERFVNIVNVLISLDFASYGTLSERVNEIISIVSSTNGVYELFLGKGVGWSFFILNSEGDAVYKNFSHNTLIFFYGVLGLLGVALYLAIMRFLFFPVKSDEVTFYKVLLLSYFLISLSVLSPLTSILNALVISYAVKYVFFKSY